MTKKTKSILLSAITTLLVLSAPIVRGAGVTIITHGLGGNASGWVTGMANQIPNYTGFPGYSYTFYKLYFVDIGGGTYQLVWSRLGGTQPSLTDSGEIIAVLDWSQLADGNVFNTYQIAGVVASVLQNTNFISEMNGHALCELPLHLIGHSRGGSVMSEVSLRLGTNGAWVDHLTTLDPHPLNNDGFSDPYSAVDAPVRTYQNVLFHDNFWQDQSLLVHGEPVSGAYVRQLYNIYGGYQSTAFFYEHANVHLWYHGTVDERVPANDTEAQITGTEFGYWYTGYEYYGVNAGFKWSLIGRGNRTSADQPQGVGYPAIRDGYNQTWDLGAGQYANRTSLPGNNGNWPNVMKFNLVSTNQVRQGTNISVKYFYQWAQPGTSTATLRFYLDDDLNPLNANGRLLQEITVPGNGASYVSWQTLNLGLNATNAPVGNHALYATITSGGRTRHLYAPEFLTVLAPPDTVAPSVSITNPPSGRVYTNSQAVTLSANATDNVAVASVAFYDGAALKATATTAPYLYDWPFNAADNGAHLWTARAYDAAGNAATSSPVTLTVSIDTTPPTVAITSPANGQVLTTTPFTMIGTATDPGAPASGVSLVQVRVNGGSWSNATGTTSWTGSIVLSPCPNSIEARSLDNAGNYSAVASNFVSYLPPNTVPNTPVNVSPLTGATGVALAPTLQATTFTDPDCVGDTHAASQWQVLNSAGAIVVADSGTDTVNKVSWTLPTNKLAYGSNYVWRVRYQDSRSGWSSNSAQTAFTTINPLLTGVKQGTTIVLNWPTNALGFNLQWTTNLGTPTWSNATPAPVLVNGQWAVTNGLTNSLRLYRLKKP